ncbi:MAG: hypothetical protein ACL93V_03220 [Candidatus Electrothrix sp. YB6]
MKKGKTSPPEKNRQFCRRSCVAAGILLLATGSNQAAAGPSLQAGKITIDKNNADRDFAIIRMRDMTGLEADVYPNAGLWVGIRGTGWAYTHWAGGIPAADIVGNRLLFEDDAIELTCNLPNELCNLVVKRTHINENKLPAGSGLIWVGIWVSGTYYSNWSNWSGTASSSQIRYDTP